ncbi:2-oxoglutarate dehydrogenase E1 subunit family protein, partial [Nitrospirillum viridazoti]
MVTDQSSLFFAGNATFVAELYARYLQDPASVDPSWSSFFAGLDDDARVVLGEIKGASWAPNKAAVIGVPDPDAKPAAPAKG